MRYTTVTIALMAAMTLALGSLPACGTTPAAAVRLDNGLKVVVQEDHSTDLVAADIWVRAGSINETEANSGVSHFIEHLVFKSTERRGPGQADMEIESLGASAEARTSRDWAHFYTTVARRYLDKALEILADVVTHPKFRQEDIERERLVILDEIARGQADPFKALGDAVFRAAYTVHPYRFPVEGTPASIAGITRQTILDYYNKLYVPANITVVLVGDITASDGAAAARKAFADFKSRPAPAISIPREPARSETARQTIKQSTRLSYLAIAFPAPSIKDRLDVCAMDVLMSYLGVGYQSWLGAELKGRQKLAIETSTEFLTQRDPGLAIAMVSAEPGKVKKAEEALLAKIDDLRNNPIGEADLERAKRSLLGDYAFDTETFAGQAANLGFYDTIDSADFAERYAANVRSVTADDVLAVAKKYLDPSRAIVVELGP